MAVIANDDLLEARVVCSLGTQISINVYHFVTENLNIVSGDVTTADVAISLSTFFFPHYIGVVSDEASYYGVGCKRLTPTLTLEDGWAGDATAGTVTGGALPASTCGILTLLDGLGGRAHRGRKFMPFPAVDHLSAGLPNSTYVDRLDTMGGSLVAGLTAANAGASTVDLVFVLKHLDNSYDPATSVFGRSVWGQQHSRGSYGRPNVLPAWPS